MGKATAEFFSDTACATCPFVENPEERLSEFECRVARSAADRMYGIQRPSCGIKAQIIMSLIEGFEKWGDELASPLPDADAQEVHHAA